MRHWLIILRPLDWWPMLGFVIWGVVMPKDPSWQFQPILAVLALNAVYLSHAYGINLCAESNQNYPLSTWLGLGVLGLTVIFLSWLWQPVMGLSFLVGTVASFAYSVDPVHLKSRPFLGVMTNALIFAPLSFSGYLAQRPFEPTASQITLFSSLILIPIQLLHEVDHILADKAIGAQTTAVYLGPRRTIYLALFGLIPATGSAWILGHSTQTPLLEITLIWSIAVGLVSLRYRQHDLTLSRRPGLKQSIRYLSLIYGVIVAAIFLR